MAHELSGVRPAPKGNPAQPVAHWGRNYARSLLVEGKGFVYPRALNIRYFVAVTLQNAANCCATCARALSADPIFSSKLGSEALAARTPPGRPTGIKKKSLRNDMSGI